MNTFICSGWVVGLPEYGVSNNDKPYVNLAIGLQETRRAKKGSTTYIECIAYGNTAERIKKVVGKGDYLVIEDSEIVIRKWDTKNSEKRKSFKILIHKFIRTASFAGGKQEQDKTLTEAFSQLKDDSDDGLPFE